jgi:transposase
MAGTFDGLTDLEWKLCADLFPLEPTKRGRGMPHTPFRKVVHTLLYVLITGCRWCDLPRPPMGLQERRASVAAVLAGRWHTGRDVSSCARAGRGTRADSVAVRRGGWRFFPLGKAAVRALPMAGRARVSSSTASRMRLVCRWLRAPRPPTGTSGPRLSRCWMPFRSVRANGADRAHDSRCWPRRRAMLPKICAVASAHVGFGPRFPHACGKAASRREGRSNKRSRATKPSGRLPGSNARTAVWSFAGNGSPPASRHVFAVAMIHIWGHRLIVR